jgi:hypothetical protein
VHYILEKPLMRVTDMICARIKKMEQGPKLPLAMKNKYKLVPTIGKGKSKQDDPEIGPSDFIMPAA